MYMRNLLIILLLLVNAGCSSQKIVRVGSTSVVIKHIKKGNGKNFVHLHQNEKTALQAARRVVQTEGGSVLTLVHPGARNIVFYLDSNRYEFDPNRIFTDVGIKKTLKQFGPYSPKAHNEVKKLAEQIKGALPPGKIIAVHNNHDYSIKKYFPGNELQHDAKELTFDPQSFFRNFYLVTQNYDFTRLKKLGFNAVLQAPSAVDDGSLSVYLTHRDYVNVEAGYGQLIAQIHMLKVA